MSNQLMCWPDWMPYPQRPSYSYELADRTLESQMDIGTIKRVEFDTDETIISCTLILCNRLQLEWFEKFERDCLRQGSRWFRMPIFMSGHVEFYTVQFKGRPKFGSIIGISHTTVTMQLRIEKRDLLDDAIFEAVTLFGPNGLQNVAGRINLGALAGVTTIPADLMA